jgi:hypothetical protein
MRRALVPGIIAAALVALATPAAAAPPGDATATYRYPAGRACDFPVTVTLGGRMKVLTFDDGRQIITAPGETMTARNDLTGASTTHLITGTQHRQTQSDGSVLVAYAGRNGAVDPEFGLIVMVGRFTATERFLSQTPVEGNGQIIDVCAEID